MGLYHCRVTDKRGKKKSFYKDAVSEELLLMELSSEGLFPLSIKCAQGKRGYRGKNFSSKTIIEFTDTLTLMLESDLSLKDSLNIAKTVFRKGKTGDLIEYISERIHRGESFYSTLKNLGRSFGPVYLGLIRIGDKAGSLEIVMQRLSAYINNKKNISEKLISALIYPVMVLLMAVTGGILAVLFMFPKISELFESTGQGISSQMESSMDLMRAVSYGTIFFFGSLILLVILIRGLRMGDRETAVKIDRLLLRVPLFGKIKTELEVLNLIFAMETLTGSRIPIEDALCQAGRVLKNRALRFGLKKVKEKIIKGESLSSAFLSDHVFPKRIGRWIGIGERSGDPRRVFSQLRKYYQKELEKFFSRFMIMTEPALILFSGLIIVFIIVVFILPVFTIYGSVL